MCLTRHVSSSRDRESRRRNDPMAAYELLCSDPHEKLKKKKEEKQKMKP